MYGFPVALASAMKLPDPIAFHLFDLDFYWYGVLLAVGVLAAIVLAHVENRRRGLPADTAVDLCLIALPAGIVGARAAYVLTHLPLFKGRAIETLYLWDGGLSAWGALAFAAVGVYLYARKKRVRFLKLLDILTPGLTAALAVSAWGNFFNQEFYGPSVASGALKWFPLSVRLDSGAIHLALFFYLFLGLVALFAYLWFFARKRQKHNGDLCLRAVLFISLAFGVLSLFRRDGAEELLTAQIICAVAFAADLLFLILRAAREARLGKTIWPSPEEPAEDAPPLPAEESGAKNEPEAEKAAAPQESDAAEPEETPKTAAGRKAARKKRIKAEEPAEDKAE